MRVVALLAIRNEENYIERCLEHLYEQGVETCLIDNGSTDRTPEIAKSFTKKGVFRIEYLPFTGIYEWEKILEFKCSLAHEINSDWFIHHDGDEIREAPRPYANLIEAIKDADEKGYNAINSDEFVFIPTTDDEEFEGKDYVREMRYYYFFRPNMLHRVNIWKKTGVSIDLASTGGHCVLFNNRKVYPVNFILRHYIFLSKRHALEKYGKRIYSPEELAKGWHKKRAEFNPEKLKFPNKKNLKKISDDRVWDRSEPLAQHFFL